MTGSSPLDLLAPPLDDDTASDDDSSEELILLGSRFSFAGEIGMVSRGTWAWRLWAGATSAVAIFYMDCAFSVPFFNHVEEAAAAERGLIGETVDDAGEVLLKPRNA